MHETQKPLNNHGKDRPSGQVETLPVPQLMDILENMNDALYTVDEDWRITYINRKSEEIWGQRREDLLGRNIWDAFPHVVGTAPYYTYLEAMQERRAITLEYRSLFVNRWLAVRAYPSGPGLVFHFSDITARKTAEAAEQEQRQFAEALRDSLAALTSSLTVKRVMQQILDSAAIVVPSEAGCIILFEDDRGHIPYVRGFTPQAEAFFKDYWFPTASITGEPLISDKQAYFVPDTQADPTWITLPVSEWIRSSIGMPIEIRGNVIGLLVVDSGIPNHFKPADIEKLQVFARYASLALENAHHVTQLEEKVVVRTAELNDAKERVEVILNNSPDGILLVHPNLYIQQTNEAFHRLFACEPDDAYFGSLYDLIHINDVQRVKGVIETAMQALTSQPVEIRCYRKNGTIFEAELSVSYIATTATSTAGLVCMLRDITERKQAQSALAEERNLLRTMIDTIPDSIYVKDTEHRFVLINLAGAHAIGRTPEEMVSNDDFTFSPSEVAAQFYADEERIFQSGLPLLEHEEYTTGPDGKPVWIAITKVPLRNLHGAIIGLVGINRNISEQKQRERQLRYYASLQENVNDAVIATDLAFRIQSWNRAAETIYGWRAEEVIGQKVTKLLPSQYIAQEEDEEHALQALFKYGQWQGEIVQYHKDGAKLYMLSSVTILRDDQGSAFGLVGVNRNITERKRADEALREQHDLLQLVINSVPDLITVIDRTGHFHIVNERAAQIYGLTPADMIGKTDAEVNPKPSEQAFFLQTDQAALDSDQIVFIPEQTLQERCYQTSKIPLKNPVGQPDRLLAVSFDITKYKEAEVALQQSLQKERELGELKSRFFSMASHEFRAPLTSILLITERLNSYRHQLTEEQIGERLGKLQTQVYHLKDIMEDVLQLAQLEAHRTEYKPVWFDLDVLCRNILEEFQSQSEGKQRLAYTCDDSIREVNLDKQRMQQIITNLASNALKYSPEDKPVRISLKRSGESLSLQVQDKGIGIPVADLAYLFEPFHRAANVGKIAGTGLGLTITKEAVERQGGTITVKSQTGVGTTFIVSIPLASTPQTKSE